MVGLSSRILKSVQEGKGAEELDKLSDFLRLQKPAIMEMFKGKPETAVSATAPAPEK
jgi:hypothetical protein